MNLQMAETNASMLPGIKETNVDSRGRWVVECLTHSPVSTSSTSTPTPVQLTVGSMGSSDLTGKRELEITLKSLWLSHAD
ncbi:hypothetical protein CEXT_704001 [Caerostris extrusa]|uniref:Uncharacterized protein n=1 Tax=Caerostris extrusa TaxID=172846 RepID=A0AAV4VHX8_CAEEX|nr:hypothetical protein CEXT_704001 [Caerostris extrusa]